MNFKKKPCAPPEAPDLVEAVQYRVGMGFEGKYRFLKFIRGLNTTIYADGVVCKTDQAEVLVKDGWWILRKESQWFFVSDACFDRNYEAAHQTAER